MVAHAYTMVQHRQDLEASIVLQGIAALLCDALIEAAEAGDQRAAEQIPAARAIYEALAGGQGVAA